MAIKSHGVTIRQSCYRAIWGSASFGCDRLYRNVVALVVWPVTFGEVASINLGGYDSVPIRHPEGVRLTNLRWTRHSVGPKAITPLLCCRFKDTS